MNWPWVLYTPPPGLTAADQFNYIVRDNFGATAPGTVRLIPSQSTSPTIMAIEVSSAGGPLIRFAGAPGLTYHIQISPDLINWTNFADRVADDIGEFEFGDADARSVTRRFYRLAWP